MSFTDIRVILKSAIPLLDSYAPAGFTDIRVILKLNEISTMDLKENVLPI